MATVAVYAEPDEEAPFVREADLAVALGGRTSAETYLDVYGVIAAAQRAGADAIHPGYGFLSENAAFARAVVDAGLTWVGPHPEAIAAMGNKLAAKERMAAAGVPVLESVDATGLESAALSARAARLGYPLLVKAAEGGGGRGMRVVPEPAALAPALASARREAASSFGSEHVFVERYLTSVRHVEVQVLGDSHGHLIHCFERECSIQRRHQKIIEESPSPAVSPALRAQLGQAALAVARAVRYDSAGTVEFLLDDTGRFYFLEMNTRLQVEHPVTEAVTGVDLVREQLLVAQGEPLGLRQEDLQLRGHAIEARLYAEDPARDFLPTAGRILAFEPPSAPSARVDSGVESGSEVTPYFDPMLAKVIVHAPARREAALRLAAVLERTRIAGVATNRDFLVNVLCSEHFLAGDTTTDFIARVAPATGRIPDGERLRFAAVAAALVAQEDRRQTAAVLTTIPSGWRNNRSQPQTTTFRANEALLTVAYVQERDGSFAVALQGDALAPAKLHGRSSGTADVAVAGLRRQLALIREGPRWHVNDGEGDFVLVEEPRFPPPRRGEVAGGYSAPMPGKVVSVHVAPGDEVERGQLLLVLEAMKMEHHIACLEAGTVREVRVEAGAQVDAAAILVVIEQKEQA